MEHEKKPLFNRGGLALRQRPPFSSSLHLHSLRVAPPRRRHSRICHEEDGKMEGAEREREREGERAAPSRNSAADSIYLCKVGWRRAESGEWGVSVTHHRISS